MPVKFPEKLPFFDWPVPSMPAAPFQGCHALGRGDFFASPLAGEVTPEGPEGGSFLHRVPPRGVCDFLNGQKVTKEPPGGGCNRQAAPASMPSTPWTPVYGESSLSSSATTGGRKSVWLVPSPSRPAALGRGKFLSVPLYGPAWF